MATTSWVTTTLAWGTLAIGSAPAQAVPALPVNAAEELALADRQFSADGAGANVADAIGAMLAPDALSPTPQGDFAKGKAAIVERLKANPSNANATAQWAPVRVGVSADGRHGFTYGFMTIRSPGQPDRRAKYLSYWVKQPEGWRVFGYKRAGSPEGEVATAIRAPALPARMIPIRPSVALRSKYSTSLAARETAFSNRARVAGLRQAFAEFGSADAMNMGPGADFVYGHKAIAAGLPDDVPSPVTWGPDEHVTVSSTGDLGVTFGFIRPIGSSTAIPFFTVWRRDRANDPWLYVAE